MTTAEQVEPTSPYPTDASPTNDVLLQERSSQGADDAMFRRVDQWAKAIDDWTAWLTISSNSKGTITLRRYQIRRLAEAHLAKSPWKVSTDDLAQWLAAQNWEAGTRDSMRSALRTFYTWGVESKRIKVSPADRLPSIRLHRGQPRPTPDDVWEAAIADATDRSRLILFCGGYAGMRRGEIAALRWDWITGDHLRIIGKGGHTRLVPLHATLAAALTAESQRRQSGEYGTGWRYRLDDDNGYVFPGRTGGHVAPEVVGRAAKAALGGKWTTHTTRHRFGTRAYAGTSDLAAVQDLMGHTSPTITRTYTRVSDTALRAAVDSL